VHDVGSGGLALALAEMAAVTGYGAIVDELEGHGELFSEFPGRFVMATNDLGRSAHERTARMSPSLPSARLVVSVCRSVQALICRWLTSRLVVEKRSRTPSIRSANAPP